MLKATAQLLRYYRNKSLPSLIPIHSPRFLDEDYEYVRECMQSGLVSTASPTVCKFESELCAAVSARHALATNSGTSALHLALLCVGVRPGDYVICPSVSFVATANAIRYCGAEPIFVAVDERLNLRTKALRMFFESCTTRGPKFQGRMVSAIIPVHLFGHPHPQIEEIVTLCKAMGLAVVEDAAQALGSWSNSVHCGLFGDFGVFSFNGNKTVTTGGGGAVVTNDEERYRTAYHLSTTAKEQYPMEYVHDAVGYNCRMPGVNAALGVGQLRRLPHIAEKKKKLRSIYMGLLSDTEATFLMPSVDMYWVNAVQFSSKQLAAQFVYEMRQANVETKFCWRPLHTLKPYVESPHIGIDQAVEVAPRTVMLPSSEWLV